MADRVHRITMFKMPKKEDQDKMLEQYKKLGTAQEKDGKPYILSMVVGPAEADPRSQGYTLVSKTEFASLEDMKYYDEDCRAHGELKSFIKEVTCEGILTVYFKPTEIGGTDVSAKI
ncbi:Fc.00g042470.m01.CDS01 [Cosmosporella sp. VM-42]